MICFAAGVHIAAAKAKPKRPRTRTASSSESSGSESEPTERTVVHITSESGGAESDEIEATHETARAASKRWSLGDVVVSGTKERAESALRSLLRDVHVDGVFRIENSRATYIYMVCRLCRDARCAITQRGNTWTIKHISNALGSACARSSVGMLNQVASGTAAVAPAAPPGKAAVAPAAPDVHQSTAAKAILDVHQSNAAKAIVVAAVDALDVSQLVQAVSPATVACSECRTLTEERAVARCGNNTHTFCSTCYSDAFDHAVRGQNKGVCIAAGGVVPCTYCQPHSTFDVQKYAPLLTKACFQAWLDVLAAIQVQAETSTWMAMMKQKEEDHFQALVKAGVVTEEMQVQRHYTHISENLIQPACSRCHMYVVEFDACCALQCGRREGHKWVPGYGCGAYICAWCLECGFR